MSVKRGISLTETMMILAHCDTPDMLVAQDRYVKRYLANKIRESNITAETVPLEEINELLGFLGHTPEKSAVVAMDAVMHSLDYRYAAT